jgi:GntR family transcriptional regulator
MSSLQHQQLADSLLAQIIDGTLAVGDRLPTERHLCESSGLARGTVRRALGHLEELGMISRRPGAGTRVIAPAPVGSYQPIAQSVADIATLTAETKLDAPWIGEVVTDNSLARRIGTRTGTTWFLVEGARVYRTGNATPLCWSEHYLRGDASRTEFLRGVYTSEEVARTKIEQTIFADLLDDHIADALHAEPGGAALIIRRRARDHSGRLLSVGIHTHPGDRYKISMTL